MAPHYTQGGANARNQNSHVPSAMNGACLTVLPSVLHNHPYQAWYIYKNIHHLRGLLSCYSMCGAEEDEHPCECLSVVRRSQVERIKIKKDYLTGDPGMPSFTESLSNSKKRTAQLICSQFDSEGSSSYVSEFAMDGFTTSGLFYDHQSFRQIKSAHQSVEKELSTSLDNNCHPTCLNKHKRSSSILSKDDLMLLDTLPLISPSISSQEDSKVGDYDSDVSSGNFSPPNNLYKTELCRSWEEAGSCRYGSKCQFAHGKEDLRPISRHPKYKTEICRTFTTNGTCPYGMRCRFIHPCFNLTSGDSNVAKEDTPPCYLASSANLKTPMKIRRHPKRLPIFEAICPVSPDCAMVS
ncbi:hypothetical protein O6H91_08G113700 [Diphasiastrum complanatum]|uniref:Uncharacterized protein n=2 Tax=Diphasiastrum complanatum TaxID=34168 RepID=A0ACC2D1B7_DIPCM|nr:hypothetical protein O6H91_08G113700 [Diphasiastrum complanatum]KAJ7548018.1 hypothetical protein O6H91_08G113700 [Diphasiastrum complanatum]